jgi:hypothetical protein
MKRIIATMLLLSPMIAWANHIDVFEFKGNGSCTFNNYLAVVREFNQWGAKNDHKAEILVPIQSDILARMYWVGRRQSAAALGKATDTWCNAVADPNSLESKLLARLQACASNISRQGYETYQGTLPRADRVWCSAGRASNIRCRHEVVSRRRAATAERQWHAQHVQLNPRASHRDSIFSPPPQGRTATG